MRGQDPDEVCVDKVEPAVAGLRGGQLVTIEGVHLMPRARGDASRPPVVVLMGKKAEAQSMATLANQAAFGAAAALDLDVEVKLYTQWATASDLGFEAPLTACDRVHVLSRESKIVCTVREYGGSDAAQLDGVAMSKCSSPLLEIFVAVLQEDGVRLVLLSLPSFPPAAMGVLWGPRTRVH